MAFLKFSATISPRLSTTTAVVFYTRKMPPWLKPEPRWLVDSIAVVGRNHDRIFCFRVPRAHFTVYMW